MAWGFWTQMFGPADDLARFTIQVPLSVAVDGSITNDEFLNGDFWYDLSATAGGQYNSVGPAVVRNGNTVTWTWPSGSPEPNSPPRTPQVLTCGTF